jgi:catechol 2,3-dioxygenase-like lactoylglutathione lyase family enzyme
MKNKSKVLLVVLTAIFVCSAFSVTFAEAQPVEVWNVTWGGPGDDEGRAVATVGDFVYLAGNIDGVDAFLNKYDKAGNIIWNITWEMFPSSGDWYSDVVAMTATKGSVYLAGVTTSSNNSDFDAFLNRYDTDGNLIWNITYGGSGSFMGYATAATEDCVFLAGEITSNSSNYAAFLNRYDIDGNLIWNITWGDTAGATATTGDSVYVAGDHHGKAFLNKYDSDGNLLWNITWGELGTHGLATAATEDSVYLAGNTLPGAFLNKYDNDGNLLWNITSGGMSPGWWATAATEDSVYLAGANRSSDFNFSKASLTKYNSTDGSFIWNITWGKAGGVNGRAVAATNDSVYLAGTTAVSNTANGSAFLVKYSYPAPTPTVTPVPTSTPTPTPKLATTAPIETPTAAPPAATPSATQAPLGFEAVFAITGLLAVAFLVMIKRRN